MRGRKLRQGCGVFRDQRSYAETIAIEIPVGVGYSKAARIPTGIIT